MTSSTSSSERSSRPRWAIGLGLLVFSCVLGLPIWALWTLRASPQSFIQEIDQELVENQPTFLLLGNSIAREAIDKPLLTQGLGLAPGKAYPMLIGGSSPGHWYSALKTRVFEAGYRPPVVVIYTPFNQWRTDLGTPVGADLANLISLSEVPDPVVLEKIFRGDALAYANAQLAQRRTRVRNSLINSWNHGLVGLAQGDEKKGTLVARGRQVVEEAQQTMGQKRRKDVGSALLIVEEAEIQPPVILGRAAADISSTPIVFEETILPELIALCQTNGSRLVLVAPPLRPSDQSKDEANLVRSLIQDAVLAGADVLDLSELGLPQEAFSTRNHLIPQYRQEMTSILVELLIEHGLDQAPDGTSAEHYTAN